MKTTPTGTSVGIIILRTLLPLIILSGAVAGFLYLKKTKRTVPQKPKEEQVWIVKTEIVNISDYQPTLKLYGEATSGRTVELRSLVAGEIIETGSKLKNGSVVAKGDVLLKIDPFKYKGALTDAEARLSEAKAKLREFQANIAQEANTLKYLQEQLTLAERDLERAIQLAQRGTATKKLEDDRRVIVSQRRQSADQRKSSLEVSKSKYAQQQAIIKRLEWGVEEAQRNLKDTTLISPFNAYVNSVNAEVGRIVNANDRVATLFDTQRIDIRFTLSDSQYGRILASGEPVIGRDVMINWRVSDPPLQYKARIERVSSQINSDSGGIDVYARISNPLAGSPIRPGTFVEIRVPDRVYKNIARLPQTALFEGKYAYVVVNGRLEKRKVELVGVNGNTVLLTGDLHQNDEVLVTRLSTIGDGVKVKPLSKNSKTQDKTSQKKNTTTNLAQTPLSDTKNTKSKLGN